MSAATGNGSQIAMTAMTVTVSATNVQSTNASAMPNHIAARRFACTISAISCRGSSSCLRI